MRHGGHLRGERIRWWRGASGTQGQEHVVVIDRALGDTAQVVVSSQ